jgi:hypothetical protein
MPVPVSLTGPKALLRRHGRSLTLFTSATALAAIQCPLWAYERGLLGPDNPDLRLLLSWPVRLATRVRDLVRLATVYAAWLLVLDVRERWLELVGQILTTGDRKAG